MPTHSAETSSRLEEAEFVCCCTAQPLSDGAWISALFLRASRAGAGGASGPGPEVAQGPRRSSTAPRRFRPPRPMPFGPFNGTGSSRDRLRFCPARRLPGRAQRGPPRRTRNTRMTLARIALTLAVAGVAARLYLQRPPPQRGGDPHPADGGPPPPGPRGASPRPLAAPAERPSTENAPAHGFAENARARRRPRRSAGPRLRRFDYGRRRPGLRRVFARSPGLHAAPMDDDEDPFARTAPYRSRWDQAGAEFIASDSEWCDRLWARA